MPRTPNRSKCKRRLAAPHIRLDLLKPPDLLPIHFPPALLLRHKSRLPLPRHVIRPLQISRRVAREIQIALVEEDVDAAFEQVQDLRLRADFHVVGEPEGVSDLPRHHRVVLQRRGDVQCLPDPGEVQVRLYPGDLGVAHFVFGVAWVCDVEAVSVAAAIPGFPVVVLNDAGPAYLCSGLADRGIWMAVADAGEVHAAGEIGGHDVAARAVEDGGFDAGVCRAERFPVPEGGVEGGHVAVAYENGGEVYVRALGIQSVLGDDLRAEGGDVMALFHVRYYVNVVREGKER